MRTFVRARVPGITLLFILGAIMLVVPLAALAQAEYASASRQVEGATEAQAIVDELNALLHLAPAVSEEQNMSGAVLGVSLLPDEVPPFVLTATGLDYRRDLAAARAATDTALAEVGDPSLIEAVAEARALVDNGATVADAVDAYGTIQAEVSTAIDQRSRQLTSVAADAGQAVELLEAVAVAEAVAQLQIVVGGQATAWARVSVPFATPSTPEVMALADSVTLAHSTAAELDELVGTDSPVHPVWSAWRDSEAATDYAQTLTDTVGGWVTTGSSGDQPITDDPVVSFADLDLAALGAQLDEIGEVVATSREVSRSLSEVRSVALDAASDAAAAVRSDALDARRTVVMWITVFAALVTIVGFGLVRLLVRPTARLADATRAIREGRLEVDVPSTGTRELRSAASAMNEAIASLRLTEDQAVALAEERLDDPVLAREAPGRLGASLQSAVERLTSGLAEREELQRRLAHDAAHDGLTKLPNRSAALRHLGSALARAARGSTTVALLFIDLDEFKAINDAHGHHVGDGVLRTVAQRLVNVLRDGDFAGRLGGDEFVVIAEPVDTIDDAVDLARRVMASLTEPVTIAGSTVTPALSIGIGLSNEDHLTADELLRDADLAVYRAKELGHDCVQVCNEELRAQVLERESLEQAVRLAIANEEFALHFQPTIDTHTGAIASLEALLRWSDPAGEPIPPATFVPIAERSDLIIELDQWVLDATSRQLARWADNPLLHDIPIAVNISGRHLTTGTLVEDVTAALERAEVDPGRLIIEITETALLDDLDQAARDLAALRRLGVRVALDDFGTGYMSLATLRTLPVDILKIDHTFVSNMAVDTEHSLIELIINTGHLLGMTVTAEGVESPGQQQQLAALGSDHLQGFLFSRPLTVDALQALMADRDSLTAEQAAPSAP